MRSTPESRLAARAAGRLGLFTLDDARGAGLSDRQLARRVEIGWYERVGEAVFATTGVPWTWERKALVALTVAGPDAWLSHRAAAHVLGFDSFDECPIELTLPRGRQCDTPLARVHTTTRLHPLDVTRVGRLPVSSGARTIVDLCAVGITDDEASAAIGSAVRDGFTSEAFLRQRLRQLRGPGRHGVRFLDRVLEGPIAHSHLERAFLKLVRGAGIRDPETQVIFDRERVIRVDAWWRPEHVVSELMGHRFHVTREQQQRDAQRRNELQELGELVLEFTAADVAYRPMQTIGRLRRLLAQRRARAA